MESAPGFTVRGMPQTINDDALMDQLVKRQRGYVLAAAGSGNMLPIEDLAGCRIAVADADRYRRDLPPADLLGIHRGEVVTAYDDLSRRRSGRHPINWWIPVLGALRVPSSSPERATDGLMSEACRCGSRGPRRRNGTLRNWPRRTS